MQCALPARSKRNLQLRGSSPSPRLGMTRLIVSTRRIATYVRELRAERAQWYPLGCAAVVDFDKANTSAIAYSGEQRGVWSRRQRGGYARLKRVCRR